MWGQSSIAMQPCVTSSEDGATHSTHVTDAPQQVLARQAAGEATWNRGGVSKTKGKAPLSEEVPGRHNQRLEPASVHRPGSSMWRQSSKQSTHLILGELMLQRGEAEARKYRRGKGRGRPGWTERWQKSVLPADRSSAGGSGGPRARLPGAPKHSYSLRSPGCDAEPSPQGQSLCRTAGRPPQSPERDQAHHSSRSRRET